MTGRDEQKIPGGYILLARKMLKSDLMNHPPVWVKLWIWMLLNANFKDTGELKRGQLFASIPDMQKAMTYYIGYRKHSPSYKEIRRACEGIAKGNAMGMVKGTMKGKQGYYITISNYDKYQSKVFYDGQAEGNNERVNERTATGNPFLKDEKNVERKKEERVIRGRKTQIPENFKLSEKLIEYAKSKGVNGDLSDIKEGFILYHQKNGSKFVSWDAAWKTWIRNHVKFAKERAEKLGGTPEPPQKPLEDLLS